MKAYDFYYWCKRWFILGFDIILWGALLMRFIVFILYCVEVAKK